MKSKFIILCVIILSILLCSCGNDNVITYNETSYVTRAKNLYEEGNYTQFIDFCKIMAGNNDNKQERDNFFNYILVYFSEIDSNNAEDEYEISLEIISECLKLPLTQDHVVTGLKSIYNSIDSKLTEKSKEFMLGKWKRYDTSTLNNTIIEIYKDENGDIFAKTVALPDGETTNFKIGDIKWKDIQFANYKCFYLLDMSNSEINIETYYKNDDKTVSSYKGATATIDFEYNLINLRHDSSINEINTSNDNNDDGVDDIQTEIENGELSDNESNESSDNKEIQTQTWYRAG